MKQYNIYTDGACSGNPGPGGLAAILVDCNHKEIRRVSCGYRRTTNNRMEILAVSAGLRELWIHTQRMNISPKDIEVTIYSDSQLVINTMNLGWSRKSNNDAWNALDEAKRSFGKVSFVKVRGHANDHFNNEADKAAVEACNAPVKDVDEQYELETERKEQEDAMDIFGEEVTISELRFSGMNTTEGRKITVILSNGTEVIISGTPYGGFTQSCGTIKEEQLTVDIAFRYTGWLNGGKFLEA